MKNKSKVTVSDLSELTGVSRATISRVLNNNSGVNDEIRKKVLQAVEKTGYKRNNSVHKADKDSLPFSKITILVNDHTLLTSNNFYYPIIDKLNKKAQEFNLTLNFHINTNVGVTESLDEILNDSESIILVGSDKEDILDAIHKRSLPCVLLNGVDPLMRFSSVVPDNELASFLVTDYLIKKGHRKIKMLTANMKNSTFERTEGFMRALRMHNIEFDYKTNIIDLVKIAKKVDPQRNFILDIEQGRVGYDFGTSLYVDYLIENHYFDDCTAVFCLCDTSAISLLSKLNEHKIKVPEEISLIAIDDINISAMMNPALTTANIDRGLLASIALDILFKTAKGEILKPLRICQSVDLVERESVLDLNEK